MLIISLLLLLLLLYYYVDGSSILFTVIIIHFFVSSLVMNHSQCVQEEPLGAMTGLGLVTEIMRKFKVNDNDAKR